jgi:hypothetical protein
MLRFVAMRQIEQRRATQLANDLYQVARADRNAGMRSKALAILISWRAKLDLPKLLTAWLIEPDTDINSVLVRLEAIKLANSNRCVTMAEPLLHACRRDSHHEVRTAALGALLDLGITVDATNEVRAWLTQNRSSDLKAVMIRLEGIKQATQRRLVGLGPELRELAKQDENKEVRTKAKDALKQLGLGGWGSLLGWK